MSRFQTADRKTPFLFPPWVDEWLPEEHLARFVVEVINRLVGSGANLPKG